MASSSRIRTPLKQHWYRFRVGALPVLSFIVCVVVMFTLWQRQANQGAFVGEVEAITVNVISDLPGELTFPGERFWQVYDTVNKGQTIARLDDRPTLARLETVRAEVAKLEQDLNAARTSLQNDHLALEQRHIQEELRLILEADSLKVQELQLKASDAINLAEYKSIQAALGILESMAGAGLGGQTRLTDLRRQQEVLATQIRQNRRVLEELSKQREEAENRVAGFEALNLPSVDTVLAPIHASIVVQQSLIKEIDIELESLTIEAPIDGVISAIWRRPGERIVAGEPILTIARRDSTTVVSYFRERHGIEPYKGMAVGLQYREPGSREYPSTVEHVGPHVEQVPLHQLNDQTTTEWATPVRITIPDDMLQQGVRPGQLLNVILKEPRRGGRGSGS